MNKHISQTRLQHLRIQGFEDITAETVAEVGTWLRLAFFVCAILAGTGTALASPIFLWALVPIAATAALSSVHPVDRVYNRVIRKWTGTRSLPKRGIPARFACGLGSFWLIGTGIAFYLGANTFGYLSGGILFSIALLVSTTDICIPSIFYRLLSGRADLVWHRDAEPYDI